MWPSMYSVTGLKSISASSAYTGGTEEPDHRVAGAPARVAGGTTHHLQQGRVEAGFDAVHVGRGVSGGPVDGSRANGVLADAPVDVTGDQHSRVPLEVGKAGRDGVGAPVRHAAQHGHVRGRRACGPSAAAAAAILSCRRLRPDGVINGAHAEL